MAIDPKLLANILEKPNDDAPRLVAADALQEKGDPRGLFIMNQVLLAETGIPKIERRTLVAQTNDLLKKHGDAWTAHAKGFKHTMRRGFIDSIDADAGDLAKHGAKLFDAEPILRLTLRGVSGDKIAELGKLNLLARLTHLTVRGKLGNKGATALADVLRKRKEPLTSLNVGGTSLNAEGANALVDVATGCKTLIFTSNELGDPGASHIAAAKTLDKLETLFLTENELTDEGVEELAQSAGLSSLRRLGLARNEEVTTDSLAKIAASKKLRRLRWLEYDDDGTQTIATRG
jgi:uncharacterized protein (TIGR02996 family)